MPSFLKKFDAQHWILLATLLVTVLGPDIVKTMDLLQMSGAATWLSHALGYGAGVLALLKQFEPDSTKKSAQAGFTRVEALLLVASVATIGCAWLRSNAKPLEQDAAKLADCILSEFAKAPDAFDPVQTAIVCGAQSAEQVMQIVGAHKAAEAKEGLHK